MQALKVLVIFMAVLIVAGMALLVYGLVTRTGGEGGGSTGLLGEGSGGSGGPAASLDLPVPEGCRIAGSELAGDRLVIRLDGLAERDCQQVLVVDLASGRLVGRVRAVPGAP